MRYYSTTFQLKRKQAFIIRSHSLKVATSETISLHETTCSNIIPHLHNLFLFQCDVTRSLTRYEARGKLFIDQGRKSLYRLLRYIGQYRCNAVYT